MKASELIISLTEYMSQYGNNEVAINLLTENQSNLVIITGNYFSENYVIECDINDIKAFKKYIK